MFFSASVSIFVHFLLFLMFFILCYVPVLGSALFFVSGSVSMTLSLSLSLSFVFFVTLNNELFRNDKEIKQENTSPCYRPTSPRFTDQETKRDLSPLSTHRLLYLYLNPYHIEPNKVEIGKEGMWQGKIISAGLFSIS